MLQFSFFALRLPGAQGRRRWRCYCSAPSFKGEYSGSQWNNRRTYHQDEVKKIHGGVCE